MKQFWVDTRLLIDQTKSMRNKLKRGRLRQDVYMIFAKFQKGGPPNRRAMALAVPEGAVDSRCHATNF